MNRGTGAGVRAGAPSARPGPGTPAPGTPAPGTPAPGTPAPGTPAPGRERWLALVEGDAPAPPPAWRRVAALAMVLVTLGAVVLASLYATVRIE